MGLDRAGLLSLRGPHDWPWIFLDPFWILGGSDGWMQKSSGISCPMVEGLGSTSRGADDSANAWPS